MPLCFFTRKSDDRSEYYFAQMPRAKSQGESSASSGFISNYEKLPDLIKSCLDYCSIITFRYHVNKIRLARLLLAASIIKENSGENMEDVIEKIIEELMGLQMLQEDPCLDPKVRVCDLYYELFLVEVDEQDFFAKAVNLNLPVYAMIEDDGKDIPPDFKALHIHSLFLITAERRGASSSGSARGLSRAYVESLCKLQSLVVLDLDGELECLHDEIRNLVCLKYLGLSWSKLDYLPKAISNLQQLQTLDVSWSRHLRNLPIEILNLQQLRHLTMSRCIDHGEVRVPREFRNMVNLQTCDGVCAGDGIASELGALVQLKKLGVKRVSEDHASELVAAIMKMSKLVSLSLEAEGSYSQQLLPEMEQFSPPHLLQELSLTGGLVEIPDWIASMENLTTLSLSFSRLRENPTSVLQSLPKLKHLVLWIAYEVKSIGKEFCEAGGFPKLESLKIASGSLVEWSEIVEGAFPSLRCLCFRNCMKLRFLPEGLQNISTLQKLILLPAYTDIVSRLLGEENYKIKHISEFLGFEF